MIPALQYSKNRICSREWPQGFSFGLFLFIIYHHGAMIHIEEKKPVRVIILNGYFF